MDSSTTVDRVLLGACAAVWLAVIGMSVAAIVTLVEMASGRAGDTATDGPTPWALYVVIGISAAIILASVPLLWRARRAAQHEPPRQPAAPPREPVAPVTAGHPAGEAPTEKLRVFGSIAEPVKREQPREHDPLIDRLWLRFVASMAIAIGAATLAVATATYCMASRADGGAVAALVIAGIITAAMPLIPWRQARELPA